MKYPWPGNIRELKNVVEGILAMTERDEIRASDLPAKIVPRAERVEAAIEDGDVPPLEQTLREMERRLILRALQVAEGNKSKAAELLKVSRKRIYRKLEEYGIPIDEAGKETGS